MKVAPFNMRFIIAGMAILLAIWGGLSLPPDNDYYNYFFLPAFCVIVIASVFSNGWMALIVLAPSLAAVIQIFTRIVPLVPNVPSGWGFFLYFGIFPSVAIACIFAALYSFWVRRS